jgi:hypothetical protein
MFRELAARTKKVLRDRRRGGKCHQYRAMGAKGVFRCAGRYEHLYVACCVIWYSGQVSKMCWSAARERSDRTWSKWWPISNMVPSTSPPILCMVQSATLTSNSSDCKLIFKYKSIVQCMLELQTLHPRLLRWLIPSKVMWGTMKNMLLNVAAICGRF